MPAGSSASSWLTLTPIPQITASSVASSRIPATLRSATSTSFGHLSPAVGPCDRASTASATASPRRATAAATPTAPPRPQQHREEQRRPGDVLPARPHGRAPPSGARSPRPRPRAARRRAARPVSTGTPPSRGTAGRSGLGAAARRRRRLGLCRDSPQRATRPAALARPLDVGPAPLRLEPALARRRGRPRRHAAALARGALGELRDEPLDRELAVPCLAALVLRDGAEHRSRAGDDPALLRRRSATREASTSKTRLDARLGGVRVLAAGADERETRSSISSGSERDRARDTNRLPPHGVHSPGRRRGAARLGRGDPRRAGRGRAGSARPVTRSAS